MGNLNKRLKKIENNQPSNFADRLKHLTDEELHASLNILFRKMDARARGIEPDYTPFERELMQRTETYSIPDTGMDEREVDARIKELLVMEREWDYCVSKERVFELLLGESIA